MNNFELKNFNQDSASQDFVIDEDRISSMSRSRTFSVLMRSVYTWMTLALLITGFTSLYLVKNMALMQALLGSQMGVIGIIVAQLAVVIILSSRIDRMSFPVAGALFALYSILTGVTFSSIFLVYTASSIASTFFITAGTFASMSIIGYFTRKDLSSIGKYMMMALIGLIIATLVNMFMQSAMISWITSFVGVLVFVGLTAYDTQTIKDMLRIHGTEVNEHTQKYALLGSLTLYLDFINLFLYLLRFMGRRD